MVTTRHSLPLNAPPNHLKTATPEVDSTNSPSADTLTRSLAETDSREAARLATNAKFDEDRCGGGGDMGTYHWRGAVYAITADTPRHWIEQGNAEWAKTVKKREKAKKEREDGVRMRAEQMRRKASEEMKRKRGGNEREADVELVDAERRKKQRREEEVVEEKRKSMGRRRSEPRKDEVPIPNTAQGRSAISTRRKSTPTTVTNNNTSTRKRGQASTSASTSSSTASSNIEVAHTRPRPCLKQLIGGTSAKDVHPPPSDPRHDLPDDIPSEDDSLGDLPTLRGIANVAAGRRTIKHIASSRAASKKKGYHTDLLPPKPTREAFVSDLKSNLYDLSKTNDRVEQLKKWWDGVTKEGSFQLLIEIVKKIKEGKMSESDGAESLRDFADSVAEDQGVQLLLRDMEAEENERRRSVIAEEDMADVAHEMAEMDFDDRIPTPESEDPLSIPNPQPIVVVQPTPPASDAEPVEEDQPGDEVHTKTSPRVVTSPLLPALPTKDRAGNPLRWTINPVRLNNIKLKTTELWDDNRAEYQINKKRLEGESKPQRRRRVKRELKEVEGWTIIRDPRSQIEEEDEVDGGGDDDGMEGVEFEHREEQQVEIQEEIQETPEPVNGVTTATDKGETDWEAEGGKKVEEVLLREGRIGRGKTRRRRSKGKGRVV